MSRFEGKTVFITGAARGQGRSHALGFAREGANVVAVDIADQIDGLEYSLADPVDLEETAAAVGEIGAECLTVQADVRDRAAIADAVEQAASRFGGIDIVVANAGICTYGSLVDQDHHDWDITVGTNLTGVWNTLKPAVPHVIERGHGGRVVVTASSLVRHPQPNIIAYTAAKFGLIGIVKGLSRELIEHGITVNAVNPGIVNTTMGLNEGAYKLFVPGKPNPTREDAEEVMVMIGANGDPYVEPQDITDGVLFLASPEAQKISGMQLDVSGGMNAATAG